MNRREQNIIHVEEEVNNAYNLSKTPHEMIGILDGVLNELMYNRYVYNWKVNIEDINDPEVFWQLSKIDPIRTIKIKKVERNNIINELLNE